MRKVYNFNAGPAMLPEEVLLQAQNELLDWHGTGMSIMELGHRGSEFKQVAEQTEADLRELMAIPNNYHVLFLTGGATAQFAMIPLNLLGEKNKADYVDTGIWSKKAIDEAKRFGTVKIAAQVEERHGLKYIPHQKDWNISSDAAYLHYTPNETIDGIEFKWVPKPGNIPLVADMSSMILSQPIDVSQFGLIYAGAQKNMGHAGVTIVIIRDDLVPGILPGVPTLYNYRIHVDNKSFYNTPPTFAWYFAGLLFAWMKAKGGVPYFYELNQRKAKKLYDFLDQHRQFYVTKIDPECRSLMNVVFSVQDDKLIEPFLKEATAQGLENLRGHRVAGGMRASIYNAMPEAGVDKLIDFMRDFAKRMG